MNIEKYLAKIPSIEGTKYEYDINAYRKFGLDASDFEKVGYKVTDTELKDMKWGDPRIKAALKRYWDVFNSDELPQLIGEQLTDHAFNKGITTTICIAQTMLRDRYNAQLNVDGKWGKITLSTMKAAIAKYGENHVYNSIYAYRWNYYNGVSIPDTASCKNIKCDRDICKKIAETRLNRYYPPQMGFTNVQEWTSKVSSDTLSTTTIASMMAISTSKVFGVVSVTLLVASLIAFLIYKLKFKNK